MALNIADSYDDHDSALGWSWRYCSELWSIGNNSQYYVVNMIRGCRVILLTTVYGFCLCRAAIFM